MNYNKSIMNKETNDDDDDDDDNNDDDDDDDDDDNDDGDDDGVRVMWRRWSGHRRRCSRGLRRQMRC